MASGDERKIPEIKYECKIIVTRVGTDHLTCRGYQCGSGGFRGGCAGRAPPLKFAKHMF